MHFLTTTYVVGCGVTLIGSLVALSVEAHREKLGLATATEFMLPDLIALVGITVGWPLVVFVAVPALCVHKFVIGPLVRRAAAPKLVEKTLKKSP